MQQETKRQKLLGRRAAILACGQATLVGALAGRMYQLQILDSGRYKMLADENRISLRLLAPPRGRILDRFGVVLAGNRQNYHLVIVAEQAGDIETTLAAIGALITLDDTDRHRVMHEIRHKHSFVPVVVRDNLNWDEMARIEVAIPELPGVSIEQGLTRHYPFGETCGACRRLCGRGFRARARPGTRCSNCPISASAKAASRSRRTSSCGAVRGRAKSRSMRSAEWFASSPVSRPSLDRTLVIGLDMAMQDFVTRRCSGEQSVSSVLLDAVTGEVLALVSNPSFDPTVFSAGSTPAMWQALSSDPRHPLSNKAISGVLPAGSTFKPVVALGALAAGVITPETGFTCPGYFKFGNATFHCWRKGGHGTLRLRDAIKESCDVFFYKPRCGSGSIGWRQWPAVSAMAPPSVSTSPASSRG